MDQEKLRELLKEQVVEIKFHKADGSLRTMLATLKPQALPAITESASNTRTENPDVLAVWDTQVQGWRSFRWDRLQSYQAQSV